MDDPTPDLQHWRERAQEARTSAEYMIDDYSKRVMLEIAALYEQVVKRAEIKLGVSSRRKE
jgi:hypothetical protein